MVEGKTVESVKYGKTEGNEAVILHMTDGSMYLFESGSRSSFGCLLVARIENLPQDWNKTS